MTMAGTHPSPIRCVAGEDLEAHRLVKVNGSTANSVVYADAGEDAIGVTLMRAVSGAEVTVELLNVSGTLKVIAAGTIAVNASVYAANDGKVSDSVSGRKIGFLRYGGSANTAAEMVPYPRSSGDVDTEFVTFVDDFLYLNTDESGSEGFWLLDANNGGTIAATDAHGGVVALTASDTSDADNDESYLISVNEIYKPAANSLAIFTARVKLTEANTDDANIVFGLLGGDTTDVENTIADNGGITDANTYIAIHKDDGGLVWEGGVRDTAADEDTDIGAFTSGAWTELKIVVDSMDGGAAATVTFSVNGVAGGTKPFTLSSAGEMRLILGVKNGGANLETLLIDKVTAQFTR